MTPGDLNRVFFTSGGGEAVESALKLARNYHRMRGNGQKAKHIAREVAYHGTTLGALSATGITNLRSQFEPLAPGGCHVPNTNIYRWPEDREPIWAADAIEERNTVIVAGFGRFGQIVTRLLHGLGHGVTVVDHDPNQIEQTRVFGWKAYYGDAARLDLLESAGAARAKLLVVAVDDPRGARRIVDLARKHFPDLRLVVRARARTDAYAYTEIGVTHVRETFHSALEAGGCALRALGYGRHEAARLVRRFRRYDEMNVAEQAPHRKDVQRLIEASQQGREDLARLLGGETAENHGRKAWSRRAPGARSVV